MERPVTGVISFNSELLDQEKLYDLTDPNNCINLTYEEALTELKEEGKTDEEIEQELEFIEFDDAIYLIGDAWEFKDGKFTINETKELAATFSSGIICVEYSKYSKETHHTSPCYVMKDGRPCGDLDTIGNSVRAYDLPSEFYLAPQTVRFIMED